MIVLMNQKKKYYDDLSNKLNNPLTCRKKYWSILKTLLNVKKMPIIPPLNFKKTLL